MQVDSPAVSIVDLFKLNTSPRSKLFVQMIPPGIAEDEFKELIAEYMEGIDYFVFKPGKIIRDSYGHLIGLESINYGFALLNFRNPKRCHGFHRNFHQFQLVDSFGIKSKLFIEFSLRQELPVVPQQQSQLIDSPNKKSFRDLPLFKDFLKTFPFAARIEEARLAEGNESSEFIDLEREIVDEVQSQVKAEEKTTINTAVLPPPLSPVTFSSFISKTTNNDSNNRITPLVNYLKEFSISELGAPKNVAPPAKKKNQSNKSKKKAAEEPQKKTKSKNNEPKPSKQHESASKSQSRQEPKVKQPVEPKASKKHKASASNVQEIENAPQVTGVPKILGRKPVVQETIIEPSKQREPYIKSTEVALDDGIKVLSKSSKREPYVPPVDKPVLKREPYIPQDVIVNSSEADKSKPVIAKKLSFKTSKSQSQSNETIPIIIPENASPLPPPQQQQLPPPSSKNKKKPKVPKSKAEVVESTPNIIQAPSVPVVKRVFTSKAKQEQQDAQ